MIADDATREKVCEQLSKAIRARVEFIIKVPEEELVHLSLGCALNLLFLLRGEWGTIGDYMTTLTALRAIVGADLLWAEPKKTSAVPIPLVQ